MPRLGELVSHIRSKNAGPFWITVDIFCGGAEAFELVATHLATAQVAELFNQPAQDLKRFDIEELHVIKFSLPRPVVQGSRYDRDMHGAQLATLLAEFELAS